jgi:hypothetical protein
MRYFILILLFVTSLSAVASGIMLIWDPSGIMLGWNTSMLTGSPFYDYLVPGIVLFTSVGILGSIVFIYTLQRRNGYALLLLIEGGILIGWISVQVFIIKPLNALQVFIFVTGLVFVLYSLYLIKKDKGVIKNY